MQNQYEHKTDYDFVCKGFTVKRSAVAGLLSPCVQVMFDQKHASKYAGFLRPASATMIAWG